MRLFPGRCDVSCGRSEGGSLRGQIRVIWSGLVEESEGMKSVVEEKEKEAKEEKI